MKTGDTVVWFNVKHGGSGFSISKGRGVITAIDGEYVKVKTEYGGNVSKLQADVKLADSPYSIFAAAAEEVGKIRK